MSSSASTSKGKRVVGPDGLFGRVLPDGKMVITDEGSTVVYGPERKECVPKWTPGKAELVQVAFEADRALCRLRGKNDKAAKDWHSLSAEERARWIQIGPHEPERKRLYQAILGALDAATG